MGDEKDRHVPLLSHTPASAENHRGGQARLGAVWREGEGLQQHLSRGVEFKDLPYVILPQLKATDADEGEFGRVWYRILHGEWAALGWQGPALPPWAELL